MPQPYGRDNLSPEDLARQVAEHLAETSQQTRRFSLKNSVFVGRFMSGALMLGLLAVGLLAVLAGANWLLDRAGDRDPEVLAIAPTPSSIPGALSTTTSTLGSEFLLSVVTTGDGVEGQEDDSTTGRATFLPSLPSPTTTTTAPSPGATIPAATTSSSTPSGPPVTQPVTTTSTSPLPPTTLPSPTTTPTTTTVPPTTTSTLATTTSLEPTTPPLPPTTTLAPPSTTLSP